MVLITICSINFIGLIGKYICYKLNYTDKKWNTKTKRDCTNGKVSHARCSPKSKKKKKDRKDLKILVRSFCKKNNNI